MSNRSDLVNDARDGGIPGNSAVRFELHRLDRQHSILTGELPLKLLLNPLEFEHLWDMHPADFHLVKIHGRVVATPRWQQAFGRDYQYTGQVNSALPVPPILETLLAWSAQEIDPCLNGILVNWYDGQKGHYIGAHRDSTINVIKGSAIVTISLGEERVFRLRPWKGAGLIDFPVRNGTVIIMPYATNQHWTHEVPHSRNRTGRRISVTLRGFAEVGTQTPGEPSRVQGGRT